MRAGSYLHVHWSAVGGSDASAIVAVVSTWGESHCTCTCMINMGGESLYMYMYDQHGGRVTVHVHGGRVTVHVHV